MGMFDDLGPRAPTLRIPISPEEAYLLDHVLTLHSWDIDVLERLVSGVGFYPIRYEIGKVLASAQDYIEFDDEQMLNKIIALVPIMYRSNGAVGYKLKRKLWQARLGMPLDDSTAAEPPSPEQTILDD